MKVFDRELRATVDALVAAIDWAVAADVHVINLSLGTANPAHEARLAAALARAGRAGVLRWWPPASRTARAGCPARCRAWWRVHDWTGRATRPRCASTTDGAAADDGARQRLPAPDPGRAARAEPEGRQLRGGQRHRRASASTCPPRRTALNP